MLSKEQRMERVEKIQNVEYANLTLSQLKILMKEQNIRDCDHQGSGSNRNLLRKDRIRILGENNAIKPDKTINFHVLPEEIIANIIIYSKNKKNMYRICLVDKVFNSAYNKYAKHIFYSCVDFLDLLKLQPHHFKEISFVKEIRNLRIIKPTKKYDCTPRDNLTKNLYFLQNLQKVQLSDHLIGNDELKNLNEQMLTELDINYNSSISDRGLQRFTNLRVLKFGNNQNLSPDVFGINHDVSNGLFCHSFKNIIYISFDDGRTFNFRYLFQHALVVLPNLIHLQLHFYSTKDIDPIFIGDNGNHPLIKLEKLFSNESIVLTVIFYE